MDLPRWVHVVGVDTEKPLKIHEVVDAIVSVRPSALRLLVEGGPHLIGSFFEENLLNELFLTLSPQIAGRSNDEDRMGIVAGVQFAPEHPAWASLVSVRRAANHLFLRYMFESGAKRMSI
jgi:riboflavin biosynthesis pyrimidine reductase